MNTATQKITSGYKQTELGVIPEDWDVKELGELVDVKDGTHQTPKYFNSGIPFYSVESVTNNNFSNTKYISETEHRLLTKKFKIEEMDILMTRIGSIGDCKLITWKPNASFYVSLALLKPKNKLNAPYICHFSRTSIFKKELEDRSLQWAIPKKINLGEISKVKICIPKEPAEQTAIATVLSDTDALIENLKKLIVKKKAIKQGAMQLLLTGKKRLPGFSGKWEIKKISDIATVGRGRVISHREMDPLIQGKYPVYSSQTSDNGIMGYINTFDFDGEYVTWTTDGEKAGTVFYRSGKFNCTNVCGTIKLKKDNTRFIAMILSTITPKFVSKNLANPKLMNDPVKKIEIPLPHVNEQIVIATILSDMDIEIEKLESQLSKYQNIKQGMMQQLLIGKIRIYGNK